MRALLILFLGHGGLAVKFSQQAASHGDKFGSVIGILQNIQTQLQEEQARDDKLYDAHKCYCEKNKDSIAFNVDQDSVDSEKLNSAWTQAEGRAATYDEDVADHKNAIDQLNLQLEDARTRRKKEKDEFFDESNDLQDDTRQILEAIKAIAMRVPGGVPKGWNPQDVLTGLMQTEGYDEEKAEKTMTDYFANHADSFKSLTTKYLDQDSADDLSDALESIGGSAIESFLQVGNPTNPSSGELIIHSIEAEGVPINTGMQTVLGYLAGMRDSIVRQQEAMATEEKRRESASNDLVQSFLRQIDGHTSSMNKKMMQAADARVVATTAKGDYERNEARINEAQKFRDELITSCQDAEATHTRSKTDRGQEMVAVSKAIEVLQGARVAQTVLSPSLIETSSHEEPERVDRKTATAVVSVLQGKMESKQKQVSLLTYMLKTTNVDMSAVLDVLENLITELNDEQNRDDTHLGNCKTNLENAANDEADYQADKDKLAGFVSSEQVTIDEATATIKTLTRQNSDLDQEIKLAGEMRERERKEYEKTIGEKMDQQKVIETALNVLKGVYQSTAAVQEDEWTLPADEVDSFIQLEQAPEAPGAHKLQDGGFTAIDMLQDLENDIKIEQQNMNSDEGRAVEEYQNFLTDAAGQQALNKEAMAEKNYAVASAESRKSGFSTEHANVVHLLEDAKAIHDAVRVECDDFVASLHSKRADLRRADVDRLVSAKAILASRR